MEELQVPVTRRELVPDIPRNQPRAVTETRFVETSKSSRGRCQSRSVLAGTQRWCRSIGGQEWQNESAAAARQHLVERR